MTSKQQIRVEDPVWEVEILPDVFIETTKKPKVWTRFGLWVWFGVRGYDVDADGKYKIKN